MPDAKLLLILDKTNSEELKSSLRNLGYQIVGNISDGKKALESIPQLLPDLALVQMHLKGSIDGAQVGSQIYNEYDIPIIYIADQTSQTTIRRSGGTAPFGYLFGHLDEKQILATIEVALTRHTMEKRVRESERWLNAILQGIGDGVIAVDNEFYIRFMNPIAEALTSKEYVDVIGEPLEDVISLQYANSQERVTFSHAMAYLMNQNLRTGFEAELLSENGSKIPVEAFISPMSEKGKHVGMVLSFRDISERKFALGEINRHSMRTEAMLRAAEQLNTRLDVDAVLGTVCEICNKTLNTTATSAFLYDLSRDALISTTLVATTDKKENLLDTQAFGGRFEIPADLITNFLSHTEPIVAVEDIQALDIPGIPYLEKIKEMDVRSLVLSGMYQHDALIGVLVTQVHGGVRDFSLDDLELFRGLTDQAAIAVGNAILFEQVVASRERQQALTRRLVDVQEDERRNLARELHDQIGQMLTGLQFSLSAMLPRAAGEQKEKIAEIQALVGNLIAQTREISISLRPSMLDDTGLILTLIWHFDRYTSQMDVKVNFRHHNLLEKRFKPEIETTIYRIVQEALTNVARYAKTDSVDVELKLEEQTITVDISDTGAGFDLEKVDTSAHMGLNSMRERVYAVGGRMEIVTAPGEGTHIHALIPLEGLIERRQHERHSAAR
jgi:PAS domain S-box-containing protein